jgi:hypothetical protein
MSFAPRFAMSAQIRQLRIWWLDDEPDRLKKFPQSAIAKPSHLPKRGAQLKIVPLKKNDGIGVVLKDLEDAKKGKCLPDLIVIDQMLHLLVDVQRGSSWAAVIHDNHPEIALVGMTGDVPAVEELQKSKFIDFYQRDDIATGDCIPDLYAIADGYAALTKFFNLRGSAISTPLEICKLVKCPKVDEELFIACIPGNFKSNWDSGTSHLFARWIWNRLLKQPGLLYDALEIATLLGLKLNGLQLIEKHFEKCKYVGVFASTNRPRWWVSQVRDKIRELMKANMSQPLWSLGRNLAGGERRKNFFSKCHGRLHSPDTPTVVAFSDGTLRTRVQAAIADTIPIETDSPVIGFEQRRRFVRS